MEFKITENDKHKVQSKIKSILLDVFKWIIIIGISYIVLGPIITIISNSFTSIEDAYNPLVYLIPITPTLEHIKKAYTKMNYLKTLFSTVSFVFLLMIIQAFICSLVGYGFARFRFPGRNILFGCVILTIVVPIYTIMVPLYTQFRYFDLFGIIKLVTGKEGISILNTKIPITLMTLMGMGLRSGLYIYIFRQFFRGLPKEIEEAAFIDGAGSFYTYFRIMLPNAIPSIVTVLLFSLVWQYNDTFYASLFMPNSNLLALKLTTMAGSLSTVDRIYDPLHVDLIMNAAVLLAITPIIIVYVFLQRYFMEGIERSGIVG
ncbi:MAG: carbohydrate ABC transporter permease [Epulopiscium sp.]|nr:carbohydrate ABC transporter permease [Candidatus Epulonipiscium sp.]